MLEQLKALLPHLEAWAKFCDEEWRAAEEVAQQAAERASFLRARTHAADRLLADAREALEGTHSEVPL